MKTKNKSFKRLFAFLVALVMVTALVPSVIFAADSFTDVKSTDDFYENIENLYAAGVISGFPDGTFRAGEPLTRQQAAKMIAEGAGYGDHDGTGSKLTDVADLTWGRENIWALEADGVVKGFGTSKEFRPRQNITRGHVAKMIALAFNLEEGDEAVDLIDLPADEEVAEAIRVLASNGIVKGFGSSKGFRPDELVTRGQFAKMVDLAMEAADFRVVSVSAIGAKKLKVEFNKAVESVELTVKKGSVAVNVDKLELAEDGKSAIVTTVTNLTKGDYTVTVGESEVTIKVEDQKVAKINILSETAPRLPNPDEKKALVSYEVLNQYDEKMTNQNITWTISTGKAVVSEDKIKGTFQIESADGNAFIPGSKVYITGVHGTTATVVNAEVVIGLESKVAEVEFKGVYNTTKSKLEDLPAGFINNKYVLLFEAKDQYGNKIDTSASELTMLSNNPLFIAQPTTLASDVTLDDVVYKALKLESGTQVTKGGTATIQIVSNNTGKIASYTINADALPALKDFSISAPDKVIAGNDSKVEIPFEAVDQYGNAVTKFDDLNGKVTLTPAALDFEKQQDGKAKLFYSPSTNTGTTDRIETLTSLVPTNGSYSNIQLTIKPDAKPEAVIGLSKDKSTSIASGNNVKFKAEDLLLQDQYGRILTKAQVNAWIGTANNAIVIESNGTAGVITTAATGTDGFVYVTSSSAEFTVAATAIAGANTEKLVISLSTGATPPTAASVVSASSKSVTFTRVAQSEYASYEVADLGTLYNNATPGTATPGHKVVPKVYGVTEAGKKVLLPAGQYDVTLNTAKLQYAAGEIKDVDSSGYDANDFKDGNKDKDLTVKVTFVVKDSATNAAAATIEKDLIVSNATPEADAVTFTKDVVDGKAFVDVEQLNNDQPMGSVVTTATALNAFIDKVKDQYGAAHTESPVITISNVKKVEGSSFIVASNVTNAVEITNAAEGDKFTATFKYAGGKIVSVDFVVSDN